MVLTWRILHVTPYAADAWAYGGIPRVVGSVTGALAARGHDVTVVTTDVESAEARRRGPSGWRARFGAWPPTAESSGVTSRVFPNLSNALAYHAQVYTPVGLDRWLAAHAGDFDVAHVHAHRNLPEVFAARRLSRAGVPYVLSPHGTAPAIERRIFAKHVFDRVAGNRVLAGAARVLAVSRAEVSQLRALGVPAQSIALVPNPVDLDEHAAAARGRFRERFGLGTSRLVLYLGKITPRKRVDQLVAAVAALDSDDVTLVVAGNDMGGLAAVRSAVDLHRLGSRAVVTGLLTGPDRLDALADADVVVYPGEHEIFGLVPLEALLQGTPVIVADDSGCGQVILASGGGVVVPSGSVPALTSAIGDVLRSPGRWREAAMAAARGIGRRFAPARAAETLERVYERAARRSTSRRASTPRGVSFVVPVRNGAPWIPSVIAAIEREVAGRPFEIIAVDDGSRDGSSEILQSLASGGRATVIPGPGRGVSAALNAGIRAARFDLIAQIDQDVVIEAGWLVRMVDALADPAVGAAQGRYVPAPGAALFGGVMALDLAYRYAAMPGRSTDQVCTGNTLYRASALHQIGLFDETLGYGADNDVSYRLQAAGHRLVFCRTARSVHYWRETLGGYCRQQYGFGYGRLDVVARHPSRVTGDRVSPVLMMLHPVLMAAAGALAVASVAGAAVGAPWSTPAALAGGIVGLLGLERAIAGIRAAGRFGDARGLAFPVVHLIRDVVWVGAMVAWTGRRLLGLAPVPAHSMQPRESRRSIEGAGHLVTKPGP